MEEKKRPPCPNCGQPIAREVFRIDGKLYCEKCRPAPAADADKTQVLPGDADRTMAVADDGKTVAVTPEDADRTMAIGGEEGDKTVAIGGADDGKTVAIGAPEGDKTVAIGGEGDKTVAIGGKDAGATVSPDETQAPGRTGVTGTATRTGTAAGSRPQSSAAATRTQRSGTWASTVFTMNKSLAATKVIREVLKISPDVDLEQSSRMYYTRHGKPMSREEAATIQDLISRSGGESKYIFDKELGRGGMGAVFSTVDQDVRRKVAMKVMLPNTATSPGHIKRFLEEAQITGQLEHPNIVPVHEVGINEESNIYFTMKMVRGENLESVIDNVTKGKEDYPQRYSLGVMLQIFMKVCDAIGYSHAKGVLHRDLKPENLMIGDFGEVLVMDWGLAKVLGREDIHTADKGGPADKASAYHTMEGQVMGTPAYMSPEQALGKISELDERADIFSLGGILYKIFTGQAPYRGKNAREALEKARKRQLQPPDLRAPERKIPPELTAICMKAMARDKEERYVTAEDLKNDIQRYLDGRSVSARRDSLLVMAKKWVIRNKVAAMGIAGAVICLIVGIIGAAAYQEQQKQSTIAGLLAQGDALKAEGEYEQAEETFFSVLGLDMANEQARQGIAEVSGKALALKNKRLAAEKVKQVEKIAADAPALVKKIDEMTDKIEKARAGLKGYEGFEKKKPVWDAERDLLAANIDLLKTEGKVISKYTEVLSLDGENAEARAALAKIYYDKYREAESLRRDGDMAYYRELIAAFDDGTYRALLEKAGTLSITTAPAADGYFVFRFVEGPDRRLVPAPFSPKAFFEAPAGKDGAGIDPGFKLAETASKPIGKLLAGSGFNRIAQINNLRMPAGSYVVVVEKPGFVETRIPVLMGRGDEQELKAVTLLKKNDIPEGFVYIPKGEFIFGGDPEAPNSPKRSMRMAPAFLISKREVTVGEYVRFLNFQESVRPGSAENYLPRKSTDSGFYWEKVGGAYRPGPSFPLDWPVLGIAQVDARLYCKWLTKANDDRWEFRLPEEWEWEKAARSVDGRVFPWGNFFDFSFCSMGKSTSGRRVGPATVGSFSLDVSVYGIEDMGGNVSEWTESYLGNERTIALFKGAGWSKIEEKFARCAGRNGEIPEAVADDRGFRIAISIKE